MAYNLVCTKMDHMCVHTLVAFFQVKMHSVYIESLFSGSHEQKKSKIQESACGWHDIWFNSVMSKKISINFKSLWGEKRKKGLQCQQQLASVIAICGSVRADIQSLERTKGGRRKESERRESLWASKTAISKEWLWPFKVSNLIKVVHPQFLAKRVVDYLNDSVTKDSPLLSKQKRGRLKKNDNCYPTIKKKEGSTQNLLFLGDRLNSFSCAETKKPSAKSLYFS